ncbi:hypothetical protein [Nocardiopsis sp. MG754419]|uniref:hypothetical protein n=1 Tax=Nocardiopsis sp. MG754419 TaxID=2259865 RepID=UPI001BAE27E1|nr:hypothetical protein [Nocardiopsis sp. MG754419]
MSEMLAMTMRRALSGGRRTEVVRVLSVGRAGDATVLRLIVTERPLGVDTDSVAHPWTGEHDTDGRRLEMVDQLSDRWGTRRLRWERGEPVTMLWAEFVLAPEPEERSAPR